jgi:hypothetical protein
MRIFVVIFQTYSCSYEKAKNFKFCDAAIKLLKPSGTKYDEFIADGNVYGVVEYCMSTFFVVPNLTSFVSSPNSR